MIKKRYFKCNKDYFKFIEKYKKEIKIIEVKNVRKITGYGKNISQSVCCLVYDKMI